MTWWQVVWLVGIPLVLWYIWPNDPDNVGYDAGGGEHLSPDQWRDKGRKILVAVLWPLCLLLVAAVGLAEITKKLFRGR